MSPYLFLLAMGTLSNMLNIVAHKKKVGFYPHYKKLELTHLTFANDLLIFTYGTLRSFVATKKVLQ